MAFTNANCTLKNELPKFKALKVKDLNQYVLSKNVNVLSPDQKNTILNYLLDKSRDSDTYNETGSRSTNQNAGTSNSYRQRTSDAPHIRNSTRLQNRKILRWGPIAVIAIIVGAILISNHTRGIASTEASTNVGTNESTATTQTSNVSSPSDTSTNSGNSSTSASKESVERNLRSISDAIVAGKTTGAAANQSTLDAFKEYYAITGTWAQGFNQDMPTWGQIHDELLQAYQNEQQNNQYLLKFNWQTIQGDIISLQGQ